MYVERDIPPGSTTPFLSADGSYGPLYAELIVDWLARAARLDYIGVGNEFYGMLERYSLVLPDATARITHPLQAILGCILIIWIMGSISP